MMELHDTPTIQAAVQDFTQADGGSETWLTVLKKPRSRLQLPARPCSLSRTSSHPDEDSIQGLATAILNASPYPAIRRLTCTTDAGVLVVQGRVPSYFLKQMAQSQLLERLDAHLRVHNRVEVAPPHSAT